MDAEQETSRAEPFETIELEWDNYMLKCFDGQPLSPRIVTQLKRAFFSGVWIGMANCSWRFRPLVEEVRAFLSAEAAASKAAKEANQQ